MSNDVREREIRDEIELVSSLKNTCYPRMFWFFRSVKSCLNNLYKITNAQKMSSRAKHAVKRGRHDDAPALRSRMRGRYEAQNPACVDAASVQAHIDAVQAALVHQIADLTQRLSGTYQQLQDMINVQQGMTFGFKMTFRKM
jgi:hypothetical protein